MSRVQLALRVADLDAAVDFYSRLFDTPPAKRRPGYANFAITEPPLKLVLLEGEPGDDTAWTTSESRSARPNRYRPRRHGSPVSDSQLRCKKTPPAATPCRTTCGPPH